MPRTPLVSIGLPVFNGANFLAEAIDSILEQSFTDFELIIADNASTDETPEICRRYADRDSRITVVRHPKNIGAASNYNYVAKCASGEFFKWAAHDDVLGPDFLSTCLKGFDALGDDTVLVYPNFQFVDEQLKPLDLDQPFVHATSSNPIKRMRETLANLDLVTSVFGLYRREALMKTRLIGSFTSSDYVLLVETALVGKIARLDGTVQFSRRLHEGTSVKAAETQEALLAWFDPDVNAKSGKAKNREWQYLFSVNSVPGLSFGQRVLGSLLIVRRIVATALRFRMDKAKAMLKRDSDAQSSIIAGKPSENG